MSGMGLDTYPLNQILFVHVDATVDGYNTVVTGTAGFKIRVLSYVFTANAAGVVTLQDSAETPTVFASFSLPLSGGISYAGGIETPAFDVTAGLNLEVSNAAGVDTTGHLAYVLIRA